MHHQEQRSHHYLEFCLGDTLWRPWIWLVEPGRTVSRCLTRSIPNRWRRPQARWRYPLLHCFPNKARTSQEGAPDPYVTSRTSWHQTTGASLGQVPYNSGPVLAYWSAPKIIIWRCRRSWIFDWKFFPSFNNYLAIKYILRTARYTFNVTEHVPPLIFQFQFIKKKH